jgi:predicted transglutaminase-like cysteine proteinase
MTDLQHWGVKDHWDQAEDGYGDCEDYQLLKRKQLVDAGVPRRTMLMTVAWDAYHEGHALLMIRTNIGDLILDNARDEILLWKETGYQFVKRESQYSTGWVDIAAPVGTASIN